MTELKAFLGLFYFYSRYVPDVADKLGPSLYYLLRKGVSWRWETDHSFAFQQVKESLQTNRVLVHYDPKKELILTCDVSQYDVGAVLSRIMLNGNENLVAYSSRTLSTAEKIQPTRKGRTRHHLWNKKKSTSPCLNGLSGSLRILNHSSVFSAQQGLSSIACHQKLSGGLPCWWVHMIIASCTNQEQTLLLLTQWAVDLNKKTYKSRRPDASFI